MIRPQDYKFQNFFTLLFGYHFLISYSYIVIAVCHPNFSLMKYFPNSAAWAKNRLNNHCLKEKNKTKTQNQAPFSVMENIENVCLWKTENPRGMKLWGRITSKINLDLI